MALKRKKASVYNFPPPKPAAESSSEAAGGAGPSNAVSDGPANVNRVLREKTRIRQTDGYVKQQRTVVEVAGGNEPRKAKVHPDIRREREPLYDLYSGGDEGVVDDGDEAREARDSVRPTNHSYLTEADI